MEETVLPGDPRGQSTAPDAPCVQAPEARLRDETAAGPVAEDDRPAVAAPPVLEPRGEARRLLIGQCAIFGTAPDAGGEARARLTLEGVEPLKLADGISTWPTGRLKLNPKL